MAFSLTGTTHRGTPTGSRGMVAAAHPLAALAGQRILMQGGNAIDAAVATAAALNVVEPFMSGLGGIGFMHIYSADRKTHKILDYIGLTPKATDIQLFDEAAKVQGALSPLVPGACAGWFEALARYGTMEAADVFLPAIEYAEHGFPLTAIGHAFFDRCMGCLLPFPSSAETYLHDGKAPAVGALLRQPDIARTFRALATDGPELFYTGEIGRKIVEFVQSHGGLLTKDDLAENRPVWIDPVHVDYRGYRVFTPPPPCQAIQFLETLKIMEGYDVATIGHNTVQTLHYFIEAAKQATADRAEYAALENPPTNGLLSSGYAAQRRDLIAERAQPSGGVRYTSDKMQAEVTAGDPFAWMQTECTTHFDTIDASGNAVAVTQSLGGGFGSGMVVPETGIALNNFMSWFDLNPESPNAIGPSKKNEICLSPVQIWDEGGLRLLIGTPGSYGILQTTPQMIMNVIDHKMNIQAAIEAPRVIATNPGYLVNAETRIPDAVLRELERRGHEFNRVGEWNAGLGGGQGIMVDPEFGTFMGGADPRRDGYAIGW